MKIWSLQILRFWAALSVVIYHADIATFSITHRMGVMGVTGALFGRAGVDVFFVLSGVIIALTPKGLTAQAFAAKRATRILPLYGLVTAVYFAVGLSAGTLDWRQAVTSLTLWPALDRMVTPATPVAWTLCFEALFYASAALVIWRPKLIWTVLATFAACLMIRSGPVTDYLGNPIALEFLLGVGLARLPRWRGAMWLIPVGVALAWFCGPVGFPGSEPMTDLNGAMAWQRLIFFGIPAAMVVWGVLQIDARKGVLSYLGDASYALYLVHLPVIVIVTSALDRHTSLAPDVVTTVAAAASILLAWRVHELFEKPMLAWFRKPAPAPALA